MVRRCGDGREKDGDPASIPGATQVVLVPCWDTVFERFTDRARRVVVYAQEEALALSHDYIGTEHLLLGLIHEGESVAAKALESINISLEAVRSEVEDIIGYGQTVPTGHIPFTPRAKKVLELSLREALQLGHEYIGPEHILLGLLREGDGIAAQVLQKLGADLGLVRQRVIEILSGHRGPFAQEAHVPLRDPGSRGVEEGSGHPIDPGLREIDEKVREVRTLKEWAIDRQEFQIAANLRDVERTLLDRRHALQERNPGPEDGSPDERET
jgi:ATP-dependent Clp protease ATP-binding subunit ClpA